MKFFKQLFLCLYILPAMFPLHAQTVRDSTITLIKEREYKLIELPNGDLVPFVSQGRGNIDKYLENGRLVKEVFLDLYGKEYGHRIYHYYGDTLQVTLEYNKENKLKESDSVILRNNKVMEGFQTSYNYDGTETEHTTFTDTGRMTQKTVFFKNNVVQRTRMMIRADSLTLLFYDLQPGGGETNHDTIQTYYYPDGISRLVIFRNDDRFSYTINEYATDARGSIISGMNFYNQDSVGDHITSFVRRIWYKNEKPPVIDRKFFLGYWVMIDGMRYWQFMENGTIWMRRAGREKEMKRSWGWDEQRRQVYIILTAEDKEEIRELNIPGNRLYLEYKPDEQLLVYDDNKYQKRPVLKRKPRDESKVKAMLSASKSKEQK